MWWVVRVVVRSRGGRRDHASSVVVVVVAVDVYYHTCSRILLAVLAFCLWYHHVPRGVVWLLTCWVGTLRRCCLFAVFPTYSSVPRISSSFDPLLLRPIEHQPLFVVPVHFY